MRQPILIQCSKRIRAKILSPRTPDKSIKVQANNRSILSNKIIQPLITKERLISKIIKVMAFLTLHIKAWPAYREISSKWLLQLPHKSSHISTWWWPSQAQERPHLPRTINSPRRVSLSWPSVANSARVTPSRSSSPTLTSRMPSSSSYLTATCTIKRPRRCAIRLWAAK